MIMWDRIKQKKVNITLTIDEGLKQKLDEYRKKHKIKEFSPMINEMLWDWLSKNDGK